MKSVPFVTSGSQLVSGHKSSIRPARFSMPVAGTSSCLLLYAAITRWPLYKTAVKARKGKVCPSK